ncbi:hypothetical protein BDZ97DRAFT_1619637, partial [Flammula alnicola]
LHWYATLTNEKNLQMQDYLDNVRGSILSMDEDAPVVGESDDDPSNAFAGRPDRPSEYLRQRCPLCFGGENWAKEHDLVDAIVCIDACFTQKRRKSQGKAWNAPRSHPETVFMPPDEVNAMEAKVEEIQPSDKKSRAASGHKHTVPENSDPEYEPRIRVPISVLEECKESFLAADEKRIKASTLFFADTGLMALLC